MNLHPQLLQFFKQRGTVYLPGIGQIRVARVPAAYGEHGHLIPPGLKFELVHEGEFFDEATAEFYQQHPDVLEWIRANNSSIKHAISQTQGVLLNTSFSHIAYLPQLQASWTPKVQKVVKKGKFNLGNAASALFILALLAFFLPTKFNQLSASLGLGLYEMADFHRGLSAGSQSISSQLASPVVNPYFKINTTYSESFVVVSGVFSKEENAKKWMDFLSSKGIESAMIPGPSGLIRVCSLPLATDFEAVQVMSVWKKNHGISCWVLPI